MIGSRRRGRPKPCKMEGPLPGFCRTSPTDSDGFSYRILEEFLVSNVRCASVLGDSGERGERSSKSLPGHAMIKMTGRKDNRRPAHGMIDKGRKPGGLHDA